MNIQQLRYLTSLAENETLTATAAALGVSQPSISRSLRELELELHAPILKRTGRKLSFTKTGKDVLAAAQRAVSAFNDVAQAAATSSEESVLRIGVCHSTFVQLMPALQLLTRNFRKLHVQTIHASGLDEMLTLLRDGDVDVCFGMEGKPSHGLVFTAHEDFEVVLLSPSGTRLPDSVTFADLAGLPMVCLPPGRERTQMVDSLCHEAGFHPNYVLECNDPSAFLDAVRGGIGSALGWRSIGETAAGVEMRRFDPPRMIPSGFYHTRKPGTHVRALLTLARLRRSGSAGIPGRPIKPTLTTVAAVPAEPRIMAGAGKRPVPGRTGIERR